MNLEVMKKAANLKHELVKAELGYRIYLEKMMQIKTLGNGDEFVPPVEGEAAFDLWEAQTAQHKEIQAAIETVRAIESIGEKMLIRY